jgi:CheY-like chemotaxis protein
LTAEREGTDVLVKVRDTGIGIPSEHLPRVFEMFSQVAPALERSQSGLGIGLWLARGLLEMHGGHIEARSEGTGKGSEFIVRLPVLPAIPPTTQPPPPEHRDDLKAPLARRILIVDDNRDIVESLALLLRLTGNEVQTACDGLEAVEAAERYRPEVVLLDIRMPKLDGYTACRRIRETPWGKDMVIIALTGWGHEDDRRKSKAAGFNNHLVKPVKSSALLQLLAETQVQTTKM